MLIRETRGKLNTLELKSFDGTRSSKEFENLLWDIENYVVAINVPDSNKLMTSIIYLANNAKL